MFNRLVKKIVCRDGFEMSVQASQDHYCEPREDNAPSYSSVEIGFPSGPMKIKEIEEFREPVANGVYAYVPVQLVCREIAAHGGAVNGVKV